VPEPSISVAEAAVGKLERYKSSGADQISAELIQAGEEAFHSEIHKLIKLIRNKEELPHQWKETVVIPTQKKGDKTECSNYWGILQRTRRFYSRWNFIALRNSIHNC
jgi:hypothetical protein